MLYPPLDARGSGCRVETVGLCASGAPWQAEACGGVPLDVENGWLWHWAPRGGSWAVSESWRITVAGRALGAGPTAAGGCESWLSTDHDAQCPRVHGTRPSRISPRATCSPSATSASVFAAMTKSFRWSPRILWVHQVTVTCPHSVSRAG